MSSEANPVFGRGSGFRVLGNVDYRLARNVVVNEFHKGHLSRLDVCDAHPELLRAASDAGSRLPEECPICAEAHLLMVSYVFGARLAPSGRCVANKKELSKLASAGNDLAGYVIEVCPKCGWNHLDQAFSLSPRQSSRPRPKPAAGATEGPVQGSGPTRTRPGPAVVSSNGSGASNRSGAGGSEDSGDSEELSTGIGGRPEGQ